MVLASSLSIWLYASFPYPFGHRILWVRLNAVSKLVLLLKIHSCTCRAPTGRAWTCCSSSTAAGGTTRTSSSRSTPPAIALSLTPIVHLSASCMWGRRIGYSCL